MRSIEIPYGRGRQIFHIEDHRLTGVLMPETMPKAGEETEIVRRAISAPIDSARLSTLSQTAERILLITSDHTRPVPSRITLPLLLEEIREGSTSARYSSHLAPVSNTASDPMLPRIVMHALLSVIRSFAV